MSSSWRVLLCFYAVGDIATPTNLGGVANYFYHPILRTRNLATPANLEVWAQTDTVHPIAEGIAAKLYCDAINVGQELGTFAKPGGGIASQHQLWDRIVRRRLHIVVIVADSDFVRACWPGTSVSDTCMLKRLVAVPISDAPS